ncbi:MAG: discoidin domain-containing protein, partial [Terriglobus sp.]
LPDTYWSTADGTNNATVTAKFTGKKEFNLFRLREEITLGQRVREFLLEVREGNGPWVRVASGEAIGNCRIVRLEAPIQADEVRLNVRCAAPVALSEFGCFLNRA